VKGNSPEPSTSSFNANEIDPRSRLGFHLDDKRKLIPTGRCEVGIAPKLKLNVKFSEFTFESDEKVDKNSYCFTNCKKKYKKMQKLLR
jgi:hypothetical protein